MDRLLEFHHSLMRWMRLSMFANLFTLLLLAGVLVVIGTAPVAEYLSLMVYEWKWPNIFELESLRILSNGLLVFVGLFGFIRVINSHPLYDSRYLDWLRRTPWQWGMPLPILPIHFTWQDGLLIFAITLFSAWINPFDYMIYEWLRPLTITLSVMMVLQTLANGVSQQYRYVYAVLIILPFGIMSKHLVVIELFFMLAYLVSYAGTVETLSDLNYRDTVRNHLTWLFRNRSPESTVFLGRTNHQSSIESVVNASPITWPYKKLFQEPTEAYMRFTRAWMHSLIVFVWLFVVYLYSKDNLQVRASGPIAYLVILASFGLAIIRFAPNYSVMCSNFCLGKRVVDKKLIVWNHDRLLFEPLFVVLSAAVPIAIGTYASAQLADNTYLFAGILTGIPLEIFLLHTFGKPAKQLFYTGQQNMGPGKMNNKIVYAKLNAPGD